MTTTGVLAAGQPALVGAVLLWAGLVKLLGRRAAAVARRSALSRLVGKERVVPAFRLVGSVELVLGGLLLAPPVSTAEAGAATVLGVGFLGYLGYARRVAPDSSCGCLSDKPTPVRWRGIVRAAVLVAASGFALTADTRWFDAVRDRPAVATGALAVEALAVLGLSAELDGYWLLPLRRLRVRLSHPLRGTAGSGFDVPVLSSVQQLTNSPAYQAVGAALRSDLLDTWDEGEWRILNYSASHHDRPATAVFAVPRLRYEPTAVRAVLVDEADRRVLWEFTPAPVPA